MLSRQHTWTFTVTEPLQVIARFEPLPVLTNLSVSPENSGIIRYKGGQMQGEVKVLYEDSLRLQAVPAQGMKFVKWTRVDVTGLEEEWDDEDNVFFPQGGSSVTAVFDTMTYPVSISVEPAGAGKVQVERYLKEPPPVTVHRSGCCDSPVIRNSTESKTATRQVSVLAVKPRVEAPPTCTPSGVSQCEKL